MTPTDARIAAARWAALAGLPGMGLAHLASLAVDDRGPRARGATPAPDLISTVVTGAEGVA